MCSCANIPGHKPSTFAYPSSGEYLADSADNLLCNKRCTNAFAAL